MADKIKSQKHGSGKSTGGRKPMIDLGHGMSASPEAADAEMTKRRLGRATRRHRKEGHEDTLEYSGVQKYFTGNPLKAKKNESDKKKKEHIDKKVADSKRHKKYENQK